MQRAILETTICWCYFCPPYKRSRGYYFLLQWAFLKLDNPSCSIQMPNYRRLYIPGGTYFLTIVTYCRRPLFKNSENIDLLRFCVAKVQKKQPFKIMAAVISLDHLHFIWQLPLNNSNYSQRISRLKVLFTRAYKVNHPSNLEISESRYKHRESDIWQRRFWEHLIRDEADLQQHLDYIHYNPVKHRLVSCPHLWSYSSFSHWVDKGRYISNWSCNCGNKMNQV